MRPHRSLRQRKRLTRLSDSSYTTGFTTNQNKVDLYFREWQELNEATGSSPDELFNLCVYSESAILKALRELSPPQLSNFKSKLKALGVEVGDTAYHYQRAYDFGERLGKDVCNFDLSPSERAKAVQNLRLPGYNQDPVDTDADVARERLHPRSLLYRRQRLDVLIQDANLQLASHLQSLLEGSHSPPQAFIDVAKFERSSNSLLHGNRSSGGQPPIVILTKSGHSGSELRNTNDFTGLTDIKQKVQEATEEFVDVLLTSFGTIRTDISATEPTAVSNTMTVSTEVHLPLPVLPQGWTSEKDFKAIGTVSKATQRSIEPVGPHFLAHARRARHKRTFSEDDRIQAQESVKKVEDDDAGEISEPEDPAMLMRDAKDWKVRIIYLGQPIYININVRGKIIMPFLDFPNTAGRPQRSRSNVRIVRRSFVIIQIRKQQLEARKMIAFSSVFKKPPRFFLILSNVDSSIPSMRLQMLSHLPKNRLKRATSIRCGVPSLNLRRDFLGFNRYQS